MGTEPLHLIKLSVGSESIEDHAAWQAGRIAERRALGLDPRYRHVTRMWPRREAEIVGRGSIFWVIRGVVRARQAIAAFEEIRGEDGILRCGIVLEPPMIAVEPRAKAAFQGWRYLPARDAPPDLSSRRRRSEAELPSTLAEELRALGLV